MSMYRSHSHFSLQRSSIHQCRGCRSCLTVWSSDWWILCLAEPRCCRVFLTPSISFHFIPFHSIWVWVNTYRYIFTGMNIHLPAILMFTRGTRVLTHCHFIPFHSISEFSKALRQPKFTPACLFFGSSKVGSSNLH